jgi:hypothetical protein
MPIYLLLAITIRRHVSCYCETYTYSYEKFDTGIPAIDQFDLTGPEHVPDRLNLAKTASNDAIDGAKQQFQEFNKNNPLTGL